MNAGQPKKYIDARGWKCLARLPWRKTVEEAQADLDQLAERKGWSEWNA